MNSIFKNHGITRVSNAVAAGTSDINSSSVDTDNCQTVGFIVSFGAIVASAATSVKLQQSSDDGGSDAFADLSGASITVADTDDNTLVLIEITEPQERYVRCVVDRGTQNATVDSITAITKGSRKLPIDNTTDSTVSNQLTVVSPAEA